MEMWDILDEDGKKTGNIIGRDEPRLPSQFHLVVDVWIQNRYGKYLISRRAQVKSLPGMWETTSGSAISGEESLGAALREASEEVGIVLHKSNGRIISRQVRKLPLGSSILHVWLFKENIEEPSPICQPEEVSEAKWATKQEILDMIKNRDFINHLDQELSQLDISD